MSRQLDAYLQARADGATMMTAAVAAGIPITEARLTENAIVRGEIALPEPTTSKGETDMGRKAKAANDEATEVPQPDFERAIKIIRTDLNPLTEKKAKIGGDQSSAWKTIEKDCHCNKKGMKFVHQLMRMDPEIRDDVLRSVYGGMKAAGIGISRDLVDRMGDGDAPTMPVSDERAVDESTLATVAAE